MNTTLQQKKGFTLIEVVLVLAIAGLIFLIVFLALPALQRSQRDTQRKQDLSRFMSQLTNYSSNRNGAVPNSTTTLGSFVSGYLTNGGQTFNDPSTGSTYNVTYQNNKTVVPAEVGQLFYYQNAKCGDGDIDDATGSRSVAAAVYVEQGQFTCQSNNN